MFFKSTVLHVFELYDLFACSYFHLFRIAVGTTSLKSLLQWKRAMWAHSSQLGISMCPNIYSPFVTSWLAINFIKGAVKNAHNILILKHFVLINRVFNKKKSSLHYRQKVMLIDIDKYWAVIFIDVWGGASLVWA